MPRALITLEQETKTGTVADFELFKPIVVAAPSCCPHTPDGRLDVHVGQPSMFPPYRIDELGPHLYSTRQSHPHMAGKLKDIFLNIVDRRHPSGVTDCCAAVGCQHEPLAPAEPDNQRHGTPQLGLPPSWQHGRAMVTKRNAG